MGTSGGRGSTSCWIPAQPLPLRRVQRLSPDRPSKSNRSTRARTVTLMGADTTCRDARGAAAGGGPRATGSQHRGQPRNADGLAPRTPRGQQQQRRRRRPAATPGAPGCAPSMLRPPQRTTAHRSAPQRTAAHLCGDVRGRAACVLRLCLRRKLRLHGFEAYSEIARGGREAAEAMCRS